MADSSASALPDRECLEAFLAFSDGCNFTRAARALRRSQPAVHAQVRRLSETLGVVLYRRAGRGLELTDEGRRTAGFARDLMERTRAFSASLRGQGAPERVVLCAGAGAYLYLLGPAVERFAKRARGAGAPSLELLTRDAEGTFEAVQSGVAHLGVAVAVRGVKGVPAGVRAQTLVRVPQVLVVPKGHALAGERSVRVRALGAVELVLPPAGRPHRDRIEAAFHAARVPLRVAVEAQGWELLLHFAQLGLGAAIVNGCCRVPAGHVAVRVSDLPETEYVLVRRSGAAEVDEAGPVRALREAIAATVGKGDRVAMLTNAAPASETRGRGAR